MDKEDDEGRIIADKRAAVTAMLKDHSTRQWSNRRIATRCVVSHPFVAQLRREICPETITAEQAGADAVTRPAKPTKTTAMVVAPRRDPTTATERFDFHGDMLDVIKEVRGDGTIDVWISVRAVCGALGIDRKRQQEKLSTAPWATGGMKSLVAEDGKNREQFCIHLRSLPMWLATIEPSRVKPEVAAKLVTYQREAADALARHFLPQQVASAMGVPPAPPLVSGPSPRMQLDMEREARLSRALVVRQHEISAADRSMKAEALRRVAAKMEAAKVGSPAAVVALLLSSAEIATGLDLSEFRPTVEGADWQSPTQIAKALGVTVAQVGRAITALDLRGDKPGLCRSILNTAPETSGHRNVTTYLYSPAAVEYIRKHLEPDLN